MAEKLDLPNIPTTKMFLDDPDGRTLTIEWQEFFRGLWTRVGGLTAPTLKEVIDSVASETYKTEGEDFGKRLDEIEAKLASLPIPKNYDKDIADIQNDQFLDILETPKSYDQRLKHLEELVLALIDPTTDDPDNAILVLDTPKSYDNDISKLNKLQYINAKEPFKYYLPQFVWDDLQVGISNIKVPASSAPTDRLFAHGIGGGVTFPSLGFAVNDYIYFDIQTSHSMKLSTVLDSHIHYCTPTDGSGTPDRFQFQLDVIAAPIDGTYAVPSGSPYTAEHTIAADYTTLHKLFEVADIAAVNTTVSTLYKCKLTRIAATQDEYAGEVYVDFIDSHYQKDTVGSRIEDLK